MTPTTVPDGAPDAPPVTAFAAVDLGATSGRVMLGLLHHGEHADDDGDGTPRVELIETGRFTNGPVTVPVTAPGGARTTALHWDVLRLWRGVLDGLRAAGREAAARGARLAAVGVDAWAVDYGLLDADGALLVTPRCYRDPALGPVSERVYAHVPHAEHYRVNGLQHLPFTTQFQLVADAARPAFSVADGLLLVPDLMTYWLTGRRVAEVTNASTTGLLDATTRAWSPDLARRLAQAPIQGVPAGALDRLVDLLPPLVEPGTVVGTLLPAVQELTGLGAVPVVAVASHDTASAVAATPLPAPRRRTGTDREERLDVAAYVSSGTWSLVGLELDSPVLTDASRTAGFTNELGLDGSVRYLHNVMGLWVFDECRRAWERAGTPVDLAELLAAAAAEPGGSAVVDLDDPQFLTPGDMPARFAAAAERAGHEAPRTRAALARAVLDSLAAAYAQTIQRAATIAGVRVTRVHVVGGGSRNALLCRLTANAVGVPVVAGPVEAAALGNVLVQARAVGSLTGRDGRFPDLATLRDVVVASSDLTVYEPTGYEPG